MSLFQDKSDVTLQLVSIVTGIEGTETAARGPDLKDGSEIKQALGERGDSLGTEDIPRLNLGSNYSKMLRWTDLYAVRIVCQNELLKVKVLRADKGSFNLQVKDYFGALSKFSKSPNLQYHPKNFEDDYFTGKDSGGNVRKLNFTRLFCAEDDGNNSVSNC